MTTADRTADRTAVTAVIAALVRAWGDHDAEAYGALFTADASYTTWIGTRYQGPADIAGSHRVLWDKFLKGSTLGDEITDVRFYGSDTAVVTGRGEVFKRGRPKRFGKVQTYVLVREADGQWRIAAFHNTRRKALAEAISFTFAPDMAPGAHG